MGAFFQGERVIRLDTAKAISNSVFDP